MKQATARMKSTKGRYRIEVACNNVLEFVVEPKTRRQRDVTKWARALAKANKSCVVTVFDKHGKLAFL